MKLAEKKNMKTQYIMGFLIVLSYSVPVQAGPETCKTWNGLEFIRIPAGTFNMGANWISGKQIGYKDERPAHSQVVSSFCFMKDHLTEVQALSLRSKYKIKISEDDADKPEKMNWKDANTLAAAIGQEIGKKVRLPTEVEWEYAARGGLENKQFPWGDLEDTFKGASVRDILLQGRLNCAYFAVTKMVGNTEIKKCIPKDTDDYAIFGEAGCVSKFLMERIPKPVSNNFGIVNIVNNDWEWTSSRYMPYPYKSVDGREDNRVLKKDFRVIRGGNRAQESCLGYNSLRGYGISTQEFQSIYQIRLVLEE